MANTQKYVYSFGGGSAEGRADMKDLLGGKGANLAEMSLIGIPVPPGFTITTEVCADLLRPRPQAPRGSQAAGRGGPGAHGGGRRQEVRRPDRPAAGQRPLGCGPVDARHDEHDPQPRPDRRVGRRPGQEDRQSAVRLRRLSPPDRHVRLDGDGRRARAVRARARLPQEAARGQARHRPGRRRPQGAGPPLQGRLREARQGSRSPRIPKDQLWKAIMAVFNSWMGNKAVEYRRIERITGLEGDRRQRPGDGLRQHRE